MHPSDKKDDDFNIKRVLQCFLPLAMYPFGLKGCKKIDFLINAPFGRFSLAMYPFALKGCKKINFLINVPFGHFSLAIYPSDHFFLKALFLRGLRRTPPRYSSRVYR